MIFKLLVALEKIEKLKENANNYSEKEFAKLEEELLAAICSELINDEEDESEKEIPLIEQRITEHEARITALDRRISKDKVKEDILEDLE